LEQIAKYPELDCELFLDELVKKYHIDYDVPHAYLANQTKETLIKWALTCEKYEQEIEKREHLLGGIDDYIYRVTEEVIKKYIVSKVEKFKRLDNESVLNDLAVQYGFSQ